MSLKNKLMQAAAVAVESERGRVLWLIEEIEKELRDEFDNTIMTEGQHHVAKTKLRMFMALTAKLRRAIISNVHPKSPVGGADDDPGELPSQRRDDQSDEDDRGALPPQRIPGS